MRGTICSTSFSMAGIAFLLPGYLLVLIVDVVEDFAYRFLFEIVVERRLFADFTKAICYAEIRNTMIG